MCAAGNGRTARRPPPGGSMAWVSASSIVWLRPEPVCAASSRLGSSASVCPMVRRSAPITVGQGRQHAVARRGGRSDEPGAEVPVVALQGQGQLPTLAGLDLAPFTNTHPPPSDPYPPHPRRHRCAPLSPLRPPPRL